MTECPFDRRFDQGNLPVENRYRLLIDWIDIRSYNGNYLLQILIKWCHVFLHELMNRFRRSSLISYEHFRLKLYRLPV